MYVHNDDDGKGESYAILERRLSSVTADAYEKKKGIDSIEGLRYMLLYCDIVVM